MTESQLTTFYTQTVNDLTLQEALDQHYAINPQFTQWDTFDAPEARNLIKAHDISHILYGCNTSYMGEYMVQTWNGAGSNLNIPPTHIFKYLLNKDLKQLILPTSLFSYSISHIREFITVRSLIKKQAKLMTKKWQYFKEDQYLSTIVSEIRAEYGIHILE
jgi:ubiquinone biosynthesis protein Coq4